MRTPSPLPPRIASTPLRRRRARVQPAGLTLIEIIVALTVLGVGILTLADAAAAMQRRVLRDVWRMRAAELLASRIESAIAAPCDALAGGSGTLPGVEERWEIVREPPLAKIRQRVVVSALALPITLELPATVWCGDA